MQTELGTADAQPKIAARELEVWYRDHQALRPVSLEIRSNEILGIIGPANSGKTTFLRTLNRLIDLTPGVRIGGSVVLDGEDIFKEVPIEQLRTRVGMVFALPIPLPLSIFENVAYGPRRHGVRDKHRLQEIVERTLREASLWDEVKNRLHDSGMMLSGGQQQRLCIARTLAVEAEVILLDEPCSGLDPISTGMVEDALIGLKERHTIVLVTNVTAQAARVSDRTAFFLSGELVELNTPDVIFTQPADERTAGYVEGRFG
jgi:phosphate transport system ATP-binding protein